MRSSRLSRSAVLRSRSASSRRSDHGRGLVGRHDRTADAPLPESCVRGRANIVVSGGAGTGKTTLLGILSVHPRRRTLVTIEDAAELRLAKPHVVSLEARPANVEGKGEVTVRDLVRNALRMRPDRIIVGEVRGGEALDMLQAMNTGHEGSLSTAHANSTRHLLWRLETMAMMSDVDLPAAHIRAQVCAPIDVIVHLARLRGGRRVVWEIAAVEGTRRAEPVVTSLYRFRPRSGAEGGFEAVAVPEVVGTLANRGGAASAGPVRRGCQSITAVPVTSRVVVDRGQRRRGLLPATGCRSPHRTPTRFRRLAATSSIISAITSRWWPIAGVVVGGLVEGVIAAVVGAVAVRAVRPRCAGRRDARVAATVDEQLADAVRSFAAGMRAGLSVTQAMIVFAAARPGVRRACRRCSITCSPRTVDSVSLGGSLDDVLHAWAREVGTMTLGWWLAC